MFTIRTNDAHKNWRSTMDLAMSGKPVFIRRAGDLMMLSSIEIACELLSATKYIAYEYREEDGTVTLALRDMDIVAHGPDVSSAKKSLIQDIMEYAEEYYSSYELYHCSSNRKAHLPYVVKALAAKTPLELEADVLCCLGEESGYI